MTEGNNDNSALFQEVRASWLAGYQTAINELRKLADDPTIIDPLSKPLMEIAILWLESVKP